MTAPTGPDEAPSRPIPDLGFFAGPTRPGGTSTFGSPAVMSQFGSAPAVSQFSSAPAVNQFGSAPQAYAPPSPAAPAGPLATLRSTAGGRFVLRAGAGLAVALVLGVLGVGRFSGLFDGGPTIPDTLGGLAVSSDSTMRAEIQAMADQANGAFGASLAIEVYGEFDASVGHTLIIGSGDLDVAEASLSQELARMAGGVVRPVGTSICTDITGAAAAACARIGDDQLVIVVATGSSAEQTAALVEEAWAAQ